MFCFGRNWTNPHRKLDSKKRPEGGLLCHMVGKCRFFRRKKRLISCAFKGENFLLYLRFDFFNQSTVNPERSAPILIIFVFR